MHFILQLICVLQNSTVEINLHQGPRLPDSYDKIATYLLKRKVLTIKKTHVHRSISLLLATIP